MAGQGRWKNPVFFNELTFPVLKACKLLGEMSHGPHQAPETADSERETEVCCQKKQRDLSSTHWGWFSYPNPLAGPSGRCQPHLENMNSPASWALPQDESYYCTNWKIVMLLWLEGCYSVPPQAGS